MIETINWSRKAPFAILALHKQNGATTMTYKTFSIWASFDNGVSSKDFQVVAVSAEAAIQDIKEAYGECLVINQDMGV